MPDAEDVRHPGLTENLGSLETGGVAARAGHLGVLAVRGAQLERGSADTGMIEFGGVGGVS